MSSPVAPSGHKALRSAIHERVFAPVYYLYGGDDYLKDESLRHLVDAAIDPATREFNLEIRRGAELDAEVLGTLLDTPPMMADRRVIAVRDIGALKKDARAMLDRYLQKPAADVLLVLTSPAEAKVDKSMLDHAVAVEFEPLSGARVPKWIAYYVEHELGCEIAPEAMTLLQDAVGTDLAQLKIELDKLASFTSGGERRLIDEAAVSAVVGVRRGETLGDLLDAVAARDAERALSLVPHILQQPKSGAVPVVMALTTQTLALGWGRAQRDRGVAPRRLSADYYTLLKECGSVMTGRSWGEAVSAWVKYVDGWSHESLDAALEELLATDAALKETRLSNDEQQLSNLVLALCGAERKRRGAPRAA
jgi:DNA polymerase-3 subunit delta